MKILIYLNRIILIVTGILYFTIIFGLLAQIVLGAFQVIIGVGLLFFWNRLTKRQQKLLRVYGLITGVYLALWFVPSFHESDFIWLKLSIIPIAISLYFTYFLETLRIKRRNVFSLQ
jgi:Na+/proline symporter